MALTDLTRISTAGIATGSTIDSPILRKDVNFRGNQVGVTSVLFDSSEKRLDLKDNVNLTFGDDGDLKLYHNGSHSYIDETGTGNLYIRNGTKNSIWCKTGGQVNLYFNDEKKFETAETGAKVTGILTATSFSGPIVGNTNNSSGISTFYDLRVSNNLTVEGTTTTIDTNLIGVDRVEVGANSSTDVAVSIAQTGSADIINLFDGNTEVLTVTDGGNVGIGYTNPDVPLKVNGVIQSSSAFRVAGHPVVTYASFILDSGNYATRLGSTGTTTLRHTQIYAGGSHQATFDGVNTRLGIGITNPLRKVDVVGDSLLVRPTIDNISSSGNASAVNNSIIIRMPYGENPASTNHSGARFGIQFTGANNTTDVSSLNFGDDPVKSASIYGVSEDNLGYNRKVGMVFYTSNFDIAQKERLRIASDGKVAMGLTSTSGGKCDPESNHLLIRGASTVGTKSGHIMLTGDSATVDQGPQIVFSESGSGANWAGAYIGHQRKGGGSQGDLVFATRQETGDADTVPVEALRITSGGLVGIGTVPASGTTLDIDASGGGVLALRRNSINTNNKITLSHDGTDGTLESTNGVIFRAGGDERLRIDSDGRTLFGNSTNRPTRSGSSGYSGQIQMESNSEAALTITRFGSTHPSRLNLQHARGTIDSIAAAQDDDDLGQISFSGWDGDTFTNAAEIRAEVDGAPADDDMPGRLIFSTTKDGESSVTERMTITSDGSVLLGATSTSNAEQFRIHTSDSGKAIIKLTNSTTGTGTGDGFEFGLNGNEEIEFFNKENTDMFFGTNNLERLRINSSGGTKLTRTTVGGQESLGNTTNLWWKIGTWAGSGVDAAARATLTVLGSNTHNSGNPAGGETKIYLSGTGSTIHATYYSITDKHEGLNGVATKYDQSASSCEVWVRYGSGGYGSNCVYADVTSGFFTGANSNTSSTTLPDSATLATSKFSVRTSDNTNSKERLAIDPYGAVTIPGQQAGITTSTAQTDAPLQVITGSNGNALSLRARSADNAYAYINFQDNAGSKTAAEIHMFRNSQNGGKLVFGTCANDANYPTERLTIDKDGTFIVGNHTQTALAVHQGSSRGINATIGGRVYCKTDDHWDLNHVGTGEIIRFRKGNDSGTTQTHVGDIEILSSGVRYDESASDSRLKKNIETWTDEVLPHFKTLQPKKFNFNWESDSDTKTKGYMAQDVTSAFPEAFHLGKIDIGETDSNGDSVDSDRYKFSPGKMIPYLMKALQEEIAKREALEARISALEGS